MLRKVMKILAILLQSFSDYWDAVGTVSPFISFVDSCMFLSNWSFSDLLSLLLQVHRLVLLWNDISLPMMSSRDIQLNVTTRIGDMAKLYYQANLIAVAVSKLSIDAGLCAYVWGSLPMHMQATVSESIQDHPVLQDTRLYPCITTSGLSMQIHVILITKGWAAQFSPHMSFRHKSSGFSAIKLLQGCMGSRPRSKAPVAPFPCRNL